MISICTQLQRSIRTGPAVTVISGVLAGGVAWTAVGLAGLFALRMGWSAYAAAEPTKSYDSAMLVSRLVVAAVGSIAAGFLATKAANGNRKAAWWLGALLLLGSMPLHLPISHFSVWEDYPAWYHAAYLLSLVVLVQFGAYLGSTGLAWCRKDQRVGD